jgi:5-methyltetrahydropteroyltriglutamate--homocysteine methyltransferase
MLFPTSLVGSYCQPDWLIDREKLKGQFPPRTRAKELWRIPEPLLKEAQDDATRVAIREQEEAGLDILTDGEIRRESYSNRFATALDGLDLDNHGEVMTRSGKPVPVPRIVGPIRRARPVEVEDLKFLRAHTDRKVKITLPGPFTMSQQAVDEYYGDPAAAAMDYAQAVKEEMAELFAAGARSRCRACTTSRSTAPTARPPSISGRACSACPSSSISPISTTPSRVISISIRATDG